MAIGAHPPQPLDIPLKRPVLRGFWARFGQTQSDTNPPQLQGETCKDPIHRQNPVSLWDALQRAAHDVQTHLNGTSAGVVRHRALGPGLSVSETRALAVRLLEEPLPELTRTEVEARWQVGPDTARKVLAKCGHLNTRGECVPLFDILACEGMTDPLTTWALATGAERKVLASTLMTFGEWTEFVRAKTGQKVSSLKRRLPACPEAAIKIGKQHRFRRHLDPLKKLRAEKYPLPPVPVDGPAPAGDARAGID